MLLPQPDRNLERRYPLQQEGAQGFFAHPAALFGEVHDAVHAVVVRLDLASDTAAVIPRKELAYPSTQLIRRQVAGVDVMAELMNVPQKIMNDPEQAQKVATAFAKRGAAEAGGDPAVAEQAMQEMAPE